MRFSSRGLNLLDMQKPLLVLIFNYKDRAEREAAKNEEKL